MSYYDDIDELTAGGDDCYTCGRGLIFGRCTKCDYGEDGPYEVHPEAEKRWAESRAAFAALKVEQERKWAEIMARPHPVSMKGWRK